MRINQRQLNGRTEFCLRCSSTLNRIVILKMAGNEFVCVCTGVVGKCFNQ
jgi:predicted PP-loop superfamily ATPase